MQRRHILVISGHFRRNLAVFCNGHWALASTSSSWCRYLFLSSVVHFITSTYCHDEFFSPVPLLCEWFFQPNSHPLLRCCPCSLRRLWWSDSKLQKYFVQSIMSFFHVRVFLFSPAVLFPVAHANLDVCAHTFPR